MLGSLLVAPERSEENRKVITNEFQLGSGYCEKIY